MKILFRVSSLILWNPRRFLAKTAVASSGRSFHRPFRQTFLADLYYTGRQCPVIWLALPALLQYDAQDGIQFAISIAFIWNLWYDQVDASWYYQIDYNFLSGSWMAIG